MLTATLPYSRELPWHPTRGRRAARTRRPLTSSEMNRVVGVERPHRDHREESTSFPGVTRPPENGGPGFHYANMG